MLFPHAEVDVVGVGTSEGGDGRGGRSGRGCCCRRRGFEGDTAAAAARIMRPKKRREGQTEQQPHSLTRTHARHCFLFLGGAAGRTGGGGVQTARLSELAAEAELLRLRQATLLVVSPHSLLSWCCAVKAAQQTENRFRPPPPPPSSEHFRGRTMRPPLCSKLCVVSRSLVPPSLPVSWKKSHSYSYSYKCVAGHGRAAAPILQISCHVRKAMLLRVIS